jgi:hypothetical protein
MRRIAGAAAVAAAWAGMAPAAASADTVNLSGRDNGRGVVVLPGDQISLRVASCEGSCGYHWRTSKRPKSSVLRRAASTLRGQTRTFVYTARGVGRTSLRLSYQPPGRQRARRHFNLRVSVRRPLCRPPAAAPGGPPASVELRTPQAVIYSHSPSPRSGSNWHGCLFAVGDTVDVWNNSSGWSVQDRAPLRAQEGQYFGYVEAYRDRQFTSDWFYKVNVWNLATGKLAYAVDANARGEGGPDDEPTGISRFTMTENGDSAWIVARASGTELWARDAAGAVTKLDEGGVYSTDLYSEGDTIYWRKEGRLKSAVLRQPPSATPGRTLQLGGKHGRGNKVARIGAGDRIVVTLPSCEASCGYHWSTVVHPDTSILELTSTRLLPNNRREFVYTGVARGHTELRMNYYPPGQGRRAERKFQIGIAVR